MPIAYQFETTQFAKPGMELNLNELVEFENLQDLTPPIGYFATYRSNIDEEIDFNILETCQSS